MQVVKMMFTVVILFAVCWLPIHIFNLLIYFSPNQVMPETDSQFTHFTTAFFTCHWISMANSFANPIIYCFMSENFRVRIFKNEESYINEYFLKKEKMLQRLLHENNARQDGSEAVAVLLLRHPPPLDGAAPQEQQRPQLFSHNNPRPVILQCQEHRGYPLRSLHVDMFPSK
ncbi:hypothetical protein CEXT_7991 [Caerostris extrusa]|uniref:G-protein coupled receptors family 1 profile domain-containing protein n=1 Tax=Caerostris extrusa TaxID=172846 RepID=A0AAV4RXZ1_CAEEX|nr:hypothetical protein CEXT_7991 [Caerostris extrusa]